MIRLFQGVWTYRGFVAGSVAREFQTKYRSSVLGAAWNIVQPLGMILIYTLIFSEIMMAKLPNVEGVFAYSIYLCSGLLTWGLFAEVIGRSQGIFIENANILKKINFPRFCLPLIVMSSAIMNFGIVFGLFTAFTILTGTFPGLAYLGLLPVLGILIAFAIGLGVTLGVLNVFFRDVGQFVGLILPFWFWLTPIVYPPSILPASMTELVANNPMTTLIGACQAIMVTGTWPDWSTLLGPTVLSAGLCLAGLGLFRRFAGEMVDEL